MPLKRSEYNAILSKNKKRQEFKEKLRKYTESYTNPKRITDTNETARFVEQTKPVQTGGSPALTVVESNPAYINNMSGVSAHHALVQNAPYGKVFDKDAFMRQKAISAVTPTTIRPSDNFTANALQRAANSASNNIAIAYTGDPSKKNTPLASAIDASATFKNISDEFTKEYNELLDLNLQYKQVKAKISGGKKGTISKDAEEHAAKANEISALIDEKRKKVDALSNQLDAMAAMNPAVYSSKRTYPDGRTMYIPSKEKVNSAIFGNVAYLGDRASQGVQSSADDIKDFLSNMTYGLPQQLSSLMQGKEAIDNAQNEWQEHKDKIALENVEKQENRAKDTYERYSPTITGNGAMQLLGDLSENIGYNAPYQLLAMIPGVGTGLSTTARFGGSYIDAYGNARKSGASAEQANLSGTLEGINQGLGELALGGINGAGSSRILQGMSKAGLNVSNPLVKAGLNAAGVALEEGLEEVEQDIISYFIEKTYNPDAKLNAKDLAYSGLLGALSAAPNAVISIPAHAKAYKSDVNLMNSYINAVSSVSSESEASAIMEAGDNIIKACDEIASAAKEQGGEEGKEAQSRAETIAKTIKNTQETLNKNKSAVIKGNQDKKSALDNVVNNSKDDVVKNLANLVDEVSNGNNSGKNDYKATVDYILSQRDEAQAKYLQAVYTGDEEYIKQYATDYAAYEEAARQLRNNQKEVQNARSSAETYGDVTAEEAKTAAAEGNTTTETTENAPKTTEKQESFTEKSDSIRETTMKDMGFLGVNKDIDTAADELVSKYGSYKNAVDAVIKAQDSVRMDTTISDEEKQSNINRLQDIVRSIRNRNTARMKSYTDALSERLKQYGVSGVQIMDIENDNVRSSTKVNGYYDPKTKTVYVSPYLDDVRIAGAVAVHEFTHYGARADHSLVNDILKAKDTLVKSGTISEAMFDFAKYESAYTDEVSAYIASEDGRNEISALMQEGMTEEQAKAQASKDYVNEEIAAHFMQEILSKDDALDRLAKENRPLLQRILDAIVDFFSGKDAQNRRLAERAADKIRDVLRETEDVEVDNSRKSGKSTARMQSIADENAKIGNTGDGRRFSLARPTEEAGSLIAVHNVNKEKALKILDADGMPMPSIAIAKTDIGHSDFGDISFVFGVETVDPKANRYNKVYSADVWSPTFPSIEYETNQATESRIIKLYDSIKSKYGSDIAKALYPYYTNLSYELDSKGGAKGIISALSDDTGMMNVFLADTGETPVKSVVKETSTEMNANTREMAQYLIDTRGADFLNDANRRDGETSISARNRFLESHEQELRDTLQKYYERNGIDEETAKIVVESTRKGELMSQLVKPAQSILFGNTTTTTTTVDYEATKEKILDTVDKKKYKEWLNNLFGDAVKNEGIRNEKDPFTPSGNRRSFSATHYPVTLDNIVKAMRGSENVKGATTMTENAKAIRSASAEEYKSIDAIHKNEGRLQKMSESEITAQWNAFDNRLYAIIDSLMDSVPTIDDRLIESRRIGQVIIEASRNPTESNIRSTLEKYSGKGAWYKFTDQTVSDIQSLVNDIREAPTNIFEAKPERVVSLDEIKYAVVPDDLDKDTVQRMADKGIEVRTYESDNEESRLETLNKLDGVRFSKDVDTEVDSKITQSDIEQLRSIGRKSISDFTHEDIQKSEKWAKKFYSELGAKSPFFRAWFGDWRANDKSATNITSVSDISAYEAMESMPTGTFTNKDSDWSINVGAIGKRDTNSHSGREKISVKMLSEIQTIIENAVLLDTEVSEKNSSKKHSETLFMHKLYAPVDFNGDLYVAKVTVEEYGAGDSSKRFYNLRGIKIDPAGGTPGAKTSYGTMPDTRSTYSISDLYSLVKSNGKNYKENPASAVVNKDGTPKVVYHYTNGDFTVFNTDASGSNQGKTHGDGIYVSTSPTEFKYAGKNRMELYADIKNPFEMELTSEQADYILDKYASKKHDLDAYDGMYREHAKSKLTTPSRVFDYLNEYAKDNNIKTSDILSDLGYDGVHDGSEWVAFSSEQLKSVTDNIGTFDKSNPDIRQSKDVFTSEEREKIISKGYTDYLARQFVVKDKSEEHAKAISISSRKKLAQQLAKPLKGVNASDALAAITPVFETIEKADGTPEQRAEKAYKAAEKAANDIISMMKDVNTNTLYEQYTELRNYLRTTKLDTSSVKADIADYNDWRKSHMGSLKLGNDGMQIDTAYQELSGMYPEFFPTNIENPADQLIRIGEISDNLKKVMDNPILSMEGSESVVRSFANAILSGYEEYAQETLGSQNSRMRDYVKTAAETVEQKNAQIKDAQEQLADTKADFRRFAETVQTAYETDVKHLNEQIQARDKSIARLEKYVSKTEKGAMEVSRKKAISAFAKLQKTYDKPTTTNGVPENWKGIVSSMLNAFGNEDHSINAKTAIDQLAKMESLVSDSQRYDSKSVRVSTEQMENLSWQISGLRTFFENFAESQKTFGIDANNSVNIATSQNAAYIDSVRNLVETVNHLIRAENELFVGEKKAEASAIAYDFIDEIRERGKKFEKTGSESSPLKQWANSAVLDYTAPDVFLHNLGESGDQFAKAYREAQNKSTLLNQQYGEAMHRLVGDNYSADRTGIKGELIDVSINGENLKVSRQQLMSLYLLWKRPQARQHIEEGGVYFLNANGEQQGKPIVIHESEYRSLIDKLSSEDIRIADGVGKYLSETCAEWGNEASMKLYGYNKFNDPNYFPITVHGVKDQYHDEIYSVVNSLEYKSFTKHVDKNSVKALDIHDIFTVSDNHAKEMAQYSGFAPINSTFTRVYNAPGVQTALLEQYGRKAIGYMNDFLDRANGKPVGKDTNATDVSQKFASMAKKAAVGFNVSTAMKQPISYLRAAPELDMDVFAKAGSQIFTPSQYNTLYNEMVTNSGIARIKALGFSDVGIGKEARGNYSDLSFSSAYNKGKFVKSKFEDASMWLAGKADEITWVRIWDACKMQIDKENAKLSSEKRIQLTTEKFNQIVGRTQVVDSVLDSAPASYNSVFKILHPFMNEPMKTVSSLWYAYEEMKKGVPGGKQKFVKQIAATAASNLILEPLIASVIGALRDKEDEDPEKFAEKVLNKMSGISLDSETPTSFKSVATSEIVSGIAFAPMTSFFYSIFTDVLNGFEGDSMNSANLYEFTKASVKLTEALMKGDDYSGQKSIYNLAAECATSMAQAFGIPANTMRKDLNAALRTALYYTQDIVPMNNIVRWEINKLYYNLGNKSARTEKYFYDILIDAYNQEDKTAYNIMREDLDEMGIQSKEIVEIIEKRSGAIKPGSSVWNTELQARFDLPTKSTSSKVENMVTRVYAACQKIDALDESKALPKRPDKYSYTDSHGDKVEMSTQEYDKFVEDVGVLRYKLCAELSSSNAWSKLNVEQQLYAITKAYDFAARYYRQQFNAEYDSGDTWMKELYGKQLRIKDVSTTIISKAFKK